MKLLAAKEAELADIDAKCQAAESEKMDMRAQLAAKNEFAENLDTWEARFESADIKEKKGMLLNIIDRIDVYPQSIRVKYTLETRLIERLEVIAAPDWMSLPTLGGVPDGQTLIAGETAAEMMHLGESKAAPATSCGQKVVTGSSLEIRSICSQRCANSESAGLRFSLKRKTLTASTASAIWF